MTLPPRRLAAVPPTVRIPVRVHPRAGAPRLAWDGRGVELWLAEAAVDGGANRAATLAIAHWLHVAPSRVHLLRGARAREKLFAVEGPATLPPPDPLSPGAP